MAAFRSFLCPSLMSTPIAVLYALFVNNPALREQARQDFVTEKARELNATPGRLAVAITYEDVSRAVDACARKGCAAYDLQPVPLVCRRCAHASHRR
jgi:hypothetical protein